MDKNEYITKVFSKNLQRIMTDRKKSQIDIVRDLGFASSTVSEWVNGKKTPRIDKVHKLAQYFNCEMSELTGTLSDFYANVYNKRTTDLYKRIESLTDEIDIRDATFFFNGYELSEHDIEVFKQFLKMFIDVYQTTLKEGRFHRILDDEIDLKDKE